MLQSTCSGSRDNNIEKQKLFITICYLPLWFS